MVVTKSHWKKDMITSWVTALQKKRINFTFCLHVVHTSMVRTILSYVCHQILTYNATKWLIWCILTLRTLMIHMMYEDSLNRQSDISNPHLALYSYWWLCSKRNGSILDNHFYYFSSSLWSMYNPKTYVDNNSESAYEVKTLLCKIFLVF